MDLMRQTETIRQADVFFLNTRFLLITMVFIGNIIEPLVGHYASVKAVYLWIFTFHMPLFVFVTGYFGRATLTGAPAKKVMQQIVLQYIIFQSLYSLMDALVFHVPGTIHSFFMPYLLIWFLLSHLCWRAIYLLFHYLGIKHPVAVSIGLAVLIGYGGFNGSFLSLSRTFVYVPFFFIGASFNYERFASMLTSYRRVAGAAGSALLLVALYFTAHRIDPRWLFGSFTYGYLGHSEWYAGLIRMGIYVIEFTASAAFLCWVPRHVVRMTDWGKRTVYIFLLHGFVVRFTVVSGLYNHVNHPAFAVLLIAYAISFTILLGQPFIKEWTHRIIEPQTEWMVRVERKARGILGVR